MYALWKKAQRKTQSSQPGYCYPKAKRVMWILSFLHHIKSNWWLITTNVTNIIWKKVVLRPEMESSLNDNYVSSPWEKLVLSSRCETKIGLQQIHISFWFISPKMVKPWELFNDILFNLFDNYKIFPALKCPILTPINLMILWNLMRWSCCFMKFK